MPEKRNQPLLPAAAALLVALFIGAATAAPPDLTSGGVPNEDPALTFNLGPTGMRGWAYHVKVDTGESRQILVTDVDAGSPADGVLAVGDVILGADPGFFTADARKSLAQAIADAEAQDDPGAGTGILKLLRWRADSTITVDVPLPTMGAYSATAPYNCPKSSHILQNGMQYVYDNESHGRYSFGAITLLATGNATYEARAQSAARALVPSQSTMDQMMSDDRDANSMITWQRGHTLVFLAEYYLATGDTEVLPAIEAYAVNIAKNQSLFGTVGHIFAEKWPNGDHNGPMGGVYGVVNSAGLPCFLGVLLARECGLTNPELDPAIEASSRFFAYYSGKGAIPYGEHEPYIAHESNGKSGLGALYFSLQNDRVEEGKFFAKMATASGNERELGHTGSWFNYLWAPLGAAAGGEEAAAAYFSRIRWMLDLNRRWDGKFQYDCLNGEGHNNGSTWYDFRMSTAALLTYALPLRKLRITGKGHDSSRYLSSADVTEAVAADDYDASGRTDSQLISDLGNWSPKARRKAAQELGNRSISSTELSQITALATDTAGASRSRAGACFALGEIGNSSSAGVLAALLTDDDYYVRYAAGDAMRYLSRSANLVHVDTILAAAASTAAPLYPMVEEDPLQFAHGKLGMLLFYSWSAFGPKGILWDSVDGIDRNLLYPAIRAMAKTPIGLSRSTLERTYDNLTYDDVLAVSDAIVDSVINRSPADKMFSIGVRRGGVAALRKHGIAEGVPGCMVFTGDEVGGRRREGLELLGTFGGSVHTVQPDPDVVAFLESYLSDSETAATAQTALDLIAADTNPTPLVALKSIYSATADDAIVEVSANATTLRVSATDHAQGDSIFTWRQTDGPGAVTFTPNGTAATASNVLFDGTQGTYEFEVTMSDSRGLTEAYATVTVGLVDSGGPDLAPPTLDPMIWASAPAPAGGPVAYESFDYTSGTEVTGGGGGSGFSGLWTATRNNNAGWFVNSSSGLSFTDGFSNDLPVSGKSAHRTDATGRSEASRLLSSDARNALLSDGSTMWFSVLHERTTSNEYAAFVIGTDTFDVGSTWKLDGYATGGEGFGFGSSGNDTIGAVSFDDSAGLTKVDSAVDAGATRLLAGRITWSANGSNDTLELFDVTDLTTEPTTPIATVSADLDQSNFDRIAILSNKASAAFDEIRLGGSFASVAGADGDSETSITMTAAAATDPSGVEYYFTCTSGGGNDSGWQDSPTYTDTGLTPGTTYSYTVTVRDKSPAQNSAAPSAPASATTTGVAPPDITAPTLAAGDMVDDQAGGPIHDATAVLYTVTFSEAMNAATIEAADFENAGSPAATIGSVSATADPAVFEVSVTPGGVGTLQLQVKAGANLEDLAGNALVTTSAIADDTILTVTAAPAAIGILSFTEGEGPGGGGDKTIATAYDASAADKLVVVIGGEHGFSGNIGGRFNSVTYGGAALTEAVQEEAGVPTAAVFYLDDPGAAGDIVVNQENHNSSVFAIYQLSGTAPGIGAANKATTNSVSLTTTGINSLVIAGILDAGPSGGNGAPNLAADAPLSEDTLTDLEGGARYVSLSTGSTTVAGPGSGTYSFSNAGGTDLLAIVAVEFLLGGVPPMVAVPDVVGLGQSAAESVMTTANLTMGTVTTATSASVPAGDVISQDPLAGTDVAAGSAVDLVVSIGPPDTTPPTPDAATFAIAPVADSDTSISMTATTGSDPSGPVEYLFTETSGNPGGSSSGWQSSPSHTDTGLSPGTEYTYTVTLRDSLGNTGTASDPASATTTGGNDFSDWIAGYPDVGGQTGPGDDPDGDGVANAVENFFGTDPGAFSKGLEPGVMAGNTFTLTHPQAAAHADDLTVAYRWSKSLQGFHADGATAEGTRVDFTVQPDTPEAGMTTVTATVSGTPVGRLFVDVQVTQD